jgi:hypothetical protein
VKGEIAYCPVGFGVGINAGNFYGLHLGMIEEIA